MLVGVEEGACVTELDFDFIAWSVQKRAWERA
jgi:hypothetical protein